MTAYEIVKKITKILDDKKAKDIEIIKVEELTILADYFVIATGSNVTQVKALAEEIEFILSEQGVEPHHVEGKSSSWILLDYSSVVVHVFHGDTREFYDLERLWKDGISIPVSEFIANDSEEEQN